MVRENTHTPLGQVELVIFDCDGVVMDSFRSTCHFYDLLRAAVGLGPLDPAMQRELFACTVDQGIALAIPPHLRARAQVERHNITAAQLLPLVRLQPGMDQLLPGLRRRDIGVALDTNGGPDAREFLAGLGVLQHFQELVHAQHVTHPKPHPEGVELILERLGADRERTVFVGDSHTDQGAAQAAGVEFWAYRASHLEARRQIADFAELLAELD